MKEASTVVKHTEPLSSGRGRLLGKREPLEQNQRQKTEPEREEKRDQ